MKQVLLIWALTLAVGGYAVFFVNSGIDQLASAAEPLYKGYTVIQDVEVPVTHPMTAGELQKTYNPQQTVGGTSEYVQW